MRRAFALPILLVVTSALVASSLSAFEPPAVNKKGDDLEDEVQKQAAVERKEKYTTWMREFAKDTKVVETKPGDPEEQAAKLVANPIFRYSDEERFIPDATLWIWTRDARPVAFQKVEGNNHGGGQAWTICFASLSENLIKAEWREGKRYAARTPGVKFRSIPNAEPPAEKARARSVQLNGLKDRFTG